MSSNHGIPFFSIIIAVKNAQQTLHTTLQSCKANIAQLPPGSCELLVVPGGQDEAYVQAYLHQFDISARIIRSPSGLSQALNAGVHAAQGLYSLFLHADDEWGPDYLITLQGVLLRNSMLGRGACVVYTTVEFMDHNGQALYRRFPPPYISFIHKFHSIILHPNAVYPTFLLRRHPFPVLDNGRPCDREQVYRLMKDAIPVRCGIVTYRFRIWSGSTTVRNAAVKRAQRPLCHRLCEIACRCYIQLFETHLLRRALMRISKGTTYWTSPPRETRHQPAEISSRL